MNNCFFLVTKFQFSPLKTVLKMHNFGQTSKCDKTANILVQNVPQACRRCPRFFHVCTNINFLRLVFNIP